MGILDPYSDPSRGGVRRLPGQLQFPTISPIEIDRAKLTVELFLSVRHDVLSALGAAIRCEQEPIFRDHGAGISSYLSHARHTIFEAAKRLEGATLSFGYSHRNAPPHAAQEFLTTALEPCIETLRNATNDIFTCYRNLFASLREHFHEAEGEPWSAAPTAYDARGFQYDIGALERAKAQQEASLEALFDIFTPHRLASLLDRNICHLNSALQTIQFNNTQFEPIDDDCYIGLNAPHARYFVGLCALLIRSHVSKIASRMSDTILQSPDFWKLSDRNFNKSPLWENILSSRKAISSMQISAQAPHAVEIVVQIPSQFVGGILASAEELDKQLSIVKKHAKTCGVGVTTTFKQEQDHCRYSVFLQFPLPDQALLKAVILPSSPEIPSETPFSDLKKIDPRSLIQHQISSTAVICPFQGFLSSRSRYCLSLVRESLPRWQKIFPDIFSLTVVPQDEQLAQALDFGRFNIALRGRVGAPTLALMDVPWHEALGTPYPWEQGQDTTPTTRMPVINSSERYIQIPMTMFCHDEEILSSLGRLHHVAHLSHLLIPTAHNITDLEIAAAMLKKSPELVTSYKNETGASRPTVRISKILHNQRLRDAISYILVAQSDQVIVRAFYDSSSDTFLSSYDSPTIRSILSEMVLSALTPLTELERSEPSAVDSRLREASIFAHQHFIDLMTKNVPNHALSNEEYERFISGAIRAFLSNSFCGFRQQDGRTELCYIGLTAPITF